MRKDDPRAVFVLEFSGKALLRFGQLSNGTRAVRLDEQSVRLADSWYGAPIHQARNAAFSAWMSTVTLKKYRGQSDRHGRDNQGVGSSSQPPRVFRRCGTVAGENSARSADILRR